MFFGSYREFGVECMLSVIRIEESLIVILGRLNLGVFV